MKNKFVFRIELHFLGIFPNIKFFIKYLEYSITYKPTTLKSEKRLREICLFFKMTKSLHILFVDDYNQKFSENKKMKFLLEEKKIKCFYSVLWEIFV